MATGKSSISQWAGRSATTRPAAEPPTVPCPPLELSTVTQSRTPGAQSLWDYPILSSDFHTCKQGGLLGGARFKP